VVEDDLTTRNCATVSCISPSSNHHACFSDLCNRAAPTLATGTAVLAAAAAAILAAAVVRNIR